MNRALTIVLFIGSVVTGLIGGAPAPAGAVDARPLGETATRLPRGRLATSVEGGHSCMVVADGTVRCWGLNGSGQLGDRTTDTPTSSVRVDGITTAIAVTTGRDHSCALLVDATVRCWGANGVGQLGNETFNPSFAPVTVSGITNAVSISGGSNHTCVRRSDGTLACWGSNQFGQIGDGSLGNNRPAPVPVRDSNNNVVSNARMVAAGSTHTCAVRADGTAACWGGNGAGQLGRGFSGGDHPLSDTVQGLAGVWLVEAGHRFSCAVLGVGELRCWGLNDTAQLGNATGQDSPTPITIATSIGATRAIALGNGHACRFLGPLIQCWGQNAVAQLGRGFSGPPAPDRVNVSGAPETVEIVAGLDRTCALNAGDVVLCWGENSARQLANGSTADVLVPTAVGGLGGAVSARGVAAGLLHSCAWRADGTAACWGAAGALGNGIIVQSEEPVAVAGLVDSLAVVAGLRHTCAQRPSGAIFCWGRNVEGQIHPFVPDDSVLTPLGGASLPGVNFAAGGEHSIGVSLDDDPQSTTFGWGGNDMLQIGTIATSSTGRFRAGPLAEAVSIAAGTEHTCALQARGTVMCWGSNEFGQLGNNSSSTGPNGVPQPVQGIVDAVAIAAGHLHTCALLVAGTVRCWGINQFRELGDGTTQVRRTPVPVPGIGVGAAVGIVAGRTFTCVLGVRGNVQCWGANGRGELGDNTFQDRPNPVAVQRATKKIETFFEGVVVTATAPLDQVVALVGGGSAHVCALRVNGQPVCWGDNGNGRLGDGTTTDRPHAMGVPSFLANIAPSAELHRNGRRLEVTALVNCPEGARFRVRLDVHQDHAKGHGQEEGKCEGGVARVPVKVSAQGRARFDEGPADARAVIDVRLKGEVIDHQEWGRVVMLQTP
jgi:alpha-tubulin suppressor-like RCC1 family protein